MNENSLWITFLHALPSIIVILIVLRIIWKTFFVVDQQTVAIVERFGRYLKSCDAGLNFKIPLIDKIVKVTSLKVQEFDQTI